MDRKERDQLDYILGRLRESHCCCFNTIGLHEECQLADFITELETGIKEYDEVPGNAPNPPGQSR